MKAQKRAGRHSEDSVHHPTHSQQPGQEYPGRNNVGPFHSDRAPIPTDEQTRAAAALAAHSRVLLENAGRSGRTEEDVTQ
ncbi:MAG: hypothetical protein ACKVPX_14915 [Myxococcaceae bacterium]